MAVPPPDPGAGLHIACDPGTAPYTWGVLGSYGTECMENVGDTLPFGAISQCPPDFALYFQNGLKQCQRIAGFATTTKCFAGTSPVVGGIIGHWETHCTRPDGVLVLQWPVNCPPDYSIETTIVDGTKFNLCHPLVSARISGTSGMSGETGASDGSEFTKL